MNTNDENNSADSQNILDRIEMLEKRLLRIERALHLEPYAKVAKAIEKKDKVQHEVNEDVESRIGEYGLAWVGSIVLIFGIIYLTQFFSSLGYALLPNIIGGGAAIGVFLVGRYINKSYANLSFLFKFTSYILIYYFIFHLHYISVNPLIQNKLLVTIILLMVNGYLFYNYLMDNKKLILILAHLLTIITLIVSNYSLLIFLGAISMALFAVSDYRRTQLAGNLQFSICLVYLIIILWAIGNPFITGRIELQTSGNYSLLFVLLVAAVFSSILITSTKNFTEESVPLLMPVITNGFLFSVTLVTVVLGHFSEHFIWIFLVLFVLCLAFASWLKINTKWKISTALYALYSFMCFSVAVFSYFNTSWAIFLLTIESLLVVAISLWFRTKLIILLNQFLFLILLLVASLSEGVSPYVYFVFALIALLSARIINWQKDRLDIKTEAIRNIYLGVLFFTLLLALYKNVPAQFVTLTWTCAAIFYFVLSIALNNVKYRYLAIATFIITVCYLFIIDLSKIDLIYRITALLFLATILFIVSVYYTRRRKKQ